MFVLKIPTTLDIRKMNPVEADDYEYTECKESESMYDGSYPLSYNIVSYYVPKTHSEVVVPFKSSRADTQYGFYEFSSREKMREWFSNNQDKIKYFIDDCPEIFI